jgi:hypothetical protein
MPSTNDFIKKETSKDDVYDMWLSQIDKLEQSTISQSSEDCTAVDNSLNLGFQLFPIIDSVSYNLFGKNGRHYLKELGYTDQEADLIFTIFRNGQMHNTQSYKIVYDDGEITWGLMSGSGSGGFTPHFSGYTSEDYPENNLPADSAFEYKRFDSQGDEPPIYYAMLQLDRLATHIRHDLHQRKANDTRTHIDFIVGHRVEGNVPQPMSTTHDKHHESKITIV